MDFQYCPNCQAFNPQTATHCEQCKAELPPDETTPPVVTPPEEPAATPEAATAEPALAAPDALSPAAPAPVAGAPRPTPAVFEAPPEVLDRVRHLDAEIEKKPGANALYLQLAQLYADAQRSDLAIRTVERCLEHDPKNSYLRHRLEQLGGPPAAQPLPGAAAPAVRTPGGAAPRQQTARVAMPLRPVYRRPVRRSRVSRAVILGGVAGALVLALGVKLLFFPGPKRVVGGAFSAAAPKWSPSGRYFAFVKSGADQPRLGLYDLRKGAHRDLAELAASDASAFAWSPDGKKIAYVGRAAREWDEAVFVVDIERGSPRRVANGRMPSWALDGTTLLMWCAGDGGYEQEEAPVLSADGELVDPGVVSYRPREPSGLCRVNAATGEVTHRAADSEGVAFGWGGEVSPVLGKVVFEKAGDGETASAEPPAPAKSADGEFVEMVDAMAARGARNVAEGSRDVSRELEARARDQKRNPKKTSSYVGDVYVSDFDGGPARPLTSDGHSGSPAWTPDGERILFADDGGLWLMNADGSGRQRAYQGKLAHPPSAQLTADSRYVLFVAPVEANAGLAQLMTGESPEDLYVARVGSSSARRLVNRHPFKQRFALSPDGKRIVYEVLADPGTLTQPGGRSELWLMTR